MEKTHKQSLLILVTNPFAALNVIHSGLALELEKSFRITVLSDILSEADIMRLNNYFGLEMVLQKAPLPRISQIEKHVRVIQMLAFALAHNLVTIRLKLAELNVATGWCFQLLSKWRIVRYASAWVATSIGKWFIQNTSIPNTLRSTLDKQFCGVLSSSPLDIRENKLSNALALHNIPTISMIISWDNLTSKCIINAAPKLVLVWSEAMAREYRVLPGTSSHCTRIEVCGSPRFDIYFQPPPSSEGIARMRKHLRIEPSARVILFCTGAVKHHTCQNYIVDDLLDYASKNTEIIIFIRCHPGDDLQRYQHYVPHRNVRIFQPFRMHDAACPPVDYAQTLKLHLSISSVCIQIASTMFLDACACNRPAINIAYDAHADTPYMRSVRRFYDYSHQVSIKPILTDSMVWDRQALFQKLDEILNGQKPSPNFRKLIAPVIHHCSTGAVRMAAHHIRECLS